MDSSELQSLFDRIGGKDAVNAAVDIFYEKVLKDKRIAMYFENTDMKAQASKQKMFLTLAFGGLANYPGKNMRDAHANLVKNGLGDEHFNAVAENLLSTLKQLNVSQNMIEEVMQIVESTRPDVLGK